VSAPEEEPYSTMFGSLKHPIRRKILRMLSEKPRTFSEMLEASGVSSSHLTYHLENLGQLVSKTDDGKYTLSTLGEAAVATMSRIEETPTKPKRLSSLPLKWKTLFVALSIGVVILAGISYTQYMSLNRITADYQQLLAYFSSGGILSPNETVILNETSFQNIPGGILTPNETLYMNETRFLLHFDENLNLP
jgi:DNA-binding transcriptional ArsR family regulator